MYINLISELEFLIEVSDFLLAHQYMRVKLNILTVYVTEHLSDRYLA